MRRAPVRPTLLDRAVAWLAPMAGARRLQARVAYSAMSGYLGARRGRAATGQWRTPAASADADTLPDLDTLRARARDLARNDPLAQSAVATKAVSVIGAGHVVLPEIDAERLGLGVEEKEAWERAAQDIWTDWASGTDCDITRTQSFAQLEDLVYRSRLLSGDVLAILRHKRRPGRLLGAAVQVVEADRLSNPDWGMDTARLAGGIELDADGAPIAYHIANRHAVDRGVLGLTEWRRVPAFGTGGRRLVLHIHGPRWRPDMSRYAPLLAPVIESLKQRARYSEAELMAAVVSACFAVGMKSPDGALGEGLSLAAAGPEAGAKGSDIRITEPGIVYDLLPDEELQSFKPGRPNPAFEPFLNAIAKEVGAGTDLPHELLVKQFQASYSASRAAMEMAWQVFRVDRAHHVDQFCRPVYAEVISEAVARGLLRAPGFFRDPLIRRAWLGSVWIGPARPTIDPVKDAQADETYLAMGVTTRTRIAAERFGADYRQIAARLEREGGPAARAGAPPGEITEEKTSDDDDGDDTDREDA